MSYSFNINPNNFLKINTIGYYNCDYTRFNMPNNPNFLNMLKNTYGNTDINELIKARDIVCNILQIDITDIINNSGISNWVIVCVPRARAFKNYQANQLMFREAVNNAVNKINGAINGLDYIIRTKDTYTTHLGNATKKGHFPWNTGPEPYPGITRDTCSIDEDKIKDQNIILIDDIYTNTVNIDEDCIQALYDKGAKNVLLYVIGYTV